MSGPTTWNSLPAELRTSSLSSQTFAKRLKTHLFDVFIHSFIHLAHEFLLHLFIFWMIFCSLIVDLLDAGIIFLFTCDYYSVTVLIQLQTGSGKTYTMGTGFDVNIDGDIEGIIPRAVKHLFHGINERCKEALNAGRPPPDFSIKAQFLEVQHHSS